MNKARILLVTPNLKGIADGTNRIQPSLGLMLIGELLIQHGQKLKFMIAHLMVGEIEN